MIERPQAICIQTANIVKSIVQQDLRSYGKLSRETAKQLQHFVKGCRLMHSFGTSYELFGGRANSKNN